MIVKEKHSDSVLYPYYCTVILEGKKATPESLIDYKYKKAYEEALHFIQLTRPLKCDPLSSDRDFCSRVVKSVDACCMKFEYVGNKTKADGSRYFKNSNGDSQYYKGSNYTKEQKFQIYSEEWLESKMSRIPDTLPIKPGMAPIYMCSSESLLRGTNSVYVSGFKPDRYGGDGLYKIGGVKGVNESLTQIRDKWINQNRYGRAVNGSLLPGLTGKAQCVITAFSGAKIL